MSNEKTKGFLQVNNQIFDYWMAELTNAEFKTLLAIVRKTKGWNKPYDRISQSQIAELTGLTTRSVRTAITALEEKKLIIVAGDDHKMRLFSINYQTVNNVKTDVTAIEKAIKDAEVISKDAEVISPQQEVISKDAEVGFLHNIQAINTINKQTTEKDSDFFDETYEQLKQQLVVSGIIPIGKRVNNDELRPEIYGYLSWCDRKNMSKGEKVNSVVGFFKKKDLEERKRYYTFPDEVNHNYFNSEDYQKSVPVTDEEAAAIRARYAGVFF